MGKLCLGLMAVIALGCGADTSLLPLEASGNLVIQASHDSLPPGVGSFRVQMIRQGSPAGCTLARTSFTLCSSSTMQVVDTLCSGSWTVAPLASGAFASSDCSGPRLTAQVSTLPGVVTIEYQSEASATLVFQGASSLRTDLTFAGSPIIPAGTQSVSIRARHTPSPDPACGTAQTDVAASCYSYTPGTDFPAQAPTSSACSGSWTVCATGWSSPGCTGASTGSGANVGFVLPFGQSGLSITDVQNPPVPCPF